MALKINMAAFLDRSCSNGPGWRAVLWVQGCPIRCPGCYNRDFWSFDPREMVDVKELAARVLNIQTIEGVTFSGGEPFSQARALGALGAILQEEGLSIVTFSGYPAEVLFASSSRDWHSLLEVTDLLIAGPFMREKQAILHLRGSSNQSLVFLSDRLKGRLPEEDTFQNMEILVDHEGTAVMTGVGGVAAEQSGNGEENLCLTSVE